MSLLKRTRTFSQNFQVKIHTEIAQKNKMLITKKSENDHNVRMKLSKLWQLFNLRWSIDNDYSIQHNLSSNSQFFALVKQEILAEYLEIILGLRVATFVKKGIIQLTETHGKKSLSFFVFSPTCPQDSFHFPITKEMIDAW